MPDPQHQILHRREDCSPAPKTFNSHIPNSRLFPLLDIHLQVLQKLAQSPLIYPTVPITTIALNMLQQATNQAEITTTSLAPKARCRAQAFDRQLCDPLTIKLAVAIPGFEMQDHGRGRDEELLAAKAFDLFRHMRETML